jgi:hypothetical protein
MMHHSSALHLNYVICNRASVYNTNIAVQNRCRPPV